MECALIAAINISKDELQYMTRNESNNSKLKKCTLVTFKKIT